MFVHISSRSCRIGLALFASWTAAAASFGQLAIPTITLLKPEATDAVAQRLSATEASLQSTAPGNFRHFGKVSVGEATDVQKLTLQFNSTAKITRITSIPDFKVEQGSSCVEGNVYQAKSVCTLLVRFTPQGAGYRLGKLTVSHTGSSVPFYVGLGGNGYAPVVSFIPSVVSTVPGTYPSSQGLLNGAMNLALDGGDTLYIADTGNGLLRYLDSSGKFTTLASGYTGLSGVAVDSFGQIYFDLPSTGKMYEIYDYGPVVQASGTGTTSCPASTPCTLSSEALSTPGEMSMDPYNHLFFVDAHQGAAFSTVQPIPANLIFLYDPFPYQTNPSAAMAVDASDNLYSLWANGGTCELVQQSLYNAENNNVAFTKIAGGHICGFSGDGGQARNAELGSKIGQIAFDVAGDLYFTDTVNNRIRRIDYTTGIIQTIAGNGASGYLGDGGPATSANIGTPTGVGVDSQGQVYIIGASATTGTLQVVRKVGTTGIVSFIGHAKGSTSTKPITITNTGNSQLNVTRLVISGTNPGDFALDPDTTSCNFIAGGTLASGQSCVLGILFKPTAAGTRKAVLTMLDNSVNNSNTIQLTGTGTLPSPTFKITTPAANASFTSGTSVPFKVTITGTSPTPTGTVTFKVDGAVFGSPVTISAGAASTTLTGLTTKAHTISATYNGDANYAAVTASETITVVAAAKAPTVMKLSTLTNPATLGHPVVFMVVVESGSSSQPKGSVTLSEGTKVLATANLSGVNALLQVPKLTAGSHVLTASYGGDNTHTATTSPALKVLVR